MGGIMKIRVVEARDLPVMDRTTKLADAYVEMKFGDTMMRTEVCRKSLNPKWNHDFRVEVPDNEILQDNPVELKICDYDMVSNGDIIGQVYIDVNILLEGGETSSNVIQGWFPIFDSFKGIRGEIYVVIKMQFFGDLNPYNESSTGVKFFSAGFAVPGIVQVQGLVEELLADSDPEHNWRDSFRSSRTSNEARQLILYRLSGRVRRQIGRKVLESGGNAVVGYQEFFDLEDENGIIVRGIGTSVTITRPSRSGSPALLSPTSLAPSPYKRSASPSTSPVMTRLGTPPLTISALDLNGNNNDADDDTVGNNNSTSAAINITNNNNNNNTGERSNSGSLNSQSSMKQFTSAKKSNKRKSHRRFNLHHYTDERIEIMLITMKSFPPNVIRKLGCAVAARSVKLISERKKGPELGKQRDSWWNELREEIRAHARALNCTHVIAYTETMEIHNDLCVLSASGTAAILDMSPFTWSPEKRIKKKQGRGCRLCHIPYSRFHSPFQMRLILCEVCKKKYVPEVLLSTAEIPPDLITIGRSCILEARVCRKKKAAKGETNALIVSEALPFVEYDLHRQLMYKLKVNGMNAAFGLTQQITFGDNYILATATATAVYAVSLPPPPVLEISRTLRVVDAEDRAMLETQKKIQAVSQYNRTANRRARRRQQLDSGGSLPLTEELIERFTAEGLLDSHSDGSNTHDSSTTTSDSSSSSDSDSSSSDSDSDHDSDTDDDENKSSRSRSEDSMQGGNRGSAGEDQAGDIQSAYVFEIDDDADEDLMASLLDPLPPRGVQFYNLSNRIPHSTMAGFPLCNIQNVVLQRRYKLDAPHQKLNQHISAIFHDLYSIIAFKFQVFAPCAICGLNTDLKIVGEDELQISLNAMVVILDSSSANNRPSPDTPSISDQLPSIPKMLDSSPHISPNIAPSSASQQQSHQFPPPNTARTTTTITTGQQTQQQLHHDTDNHLLFEMEEEHSHSAAATATATTSASNSNTSSSNSLSSTPHKSQHPAQQGLPPTPSTPSAVVVDPDTDWLNKRVLVTPLWYVAGAKIDRVIGRISQHFVRESESDAKDYGLFVHRLLSEANTIMRAHAAALGGNALINYSIHYHVTLDNPVRSSAYSLITVSGDAAIVRYYNGSHNGRAESLSRILTLSSSAIIPSFADPNNNSNSNSNSNNNNNSISSIGSVHT